MRDPEVTGINESPGKEYARCWRTESDPRDPGPVVGVGFSESTCSFLVRRERVCALTRPAEVPQTNEEPPQAPGSEARLGRRERPERRQRRAAGSGPSRADPEAGAQAPAPEGGGQRPGGEAQRRVSVEFASDAHACGALGCTASDGLLAVEKPDGERRVLCPDHARRWVR